MNGRERVLSAIAHHQPDRVPVDFGATPSSTLSAIAYRRLANALDVDSTSVRIYDVCQQVVLPDNWFLDRFSVDVIDVAQAWDHEDTAWRRDKLSDGSPCEYPAAFDCRPRAGAGIDAYLPDGTRAGFMPMGATFFDQTIFPYQEGYPSDYHELSSAMKRVTWAAFAHTPWNHACEPDFWQNLRRRTQSLRDETDRALMLVCGCNLFEWGTFLRRIDQFLMDLLTEPEEVERLLDALMEIHMDTLSRVCEAVGDLVDIIRFGDDLGTDNGPIMSPELYRRYFKPRHKALCDYVRKHSNMKTFLHSCGSLYALLPDLIEAGYDIINPVQTSARDMDPLRLKREFGQDLVFWGGGVDNRSVLNRGTPDQVREDVRRRLDVFMPGGGFVFGAIHNVMPDCPPENVLAMMETVERYGVY